MQHFSSQTNKPDDYIPSQVIAEYFRHLGYDGIRYSCSLHEGGFNLTIYDVAKCEAIFSSDLRLENMRFICGRQLVQRILMDVLNTL